MQLFLRKIAVFLIAAGLTFSGATSHAHAAISSAAEDASLHEVHQIQHYADLATDADDADCAHATTDSPVPHSHDGGLCTKCCAACTSVSLIPNALLPILLLALKHEPYAVVRTALVAHTVPTAPGVPKPL
jgi:hypothetical protein